jgi:hypothetical protein
MNNKKLYTDIQVYTQRFKDIKINYIYTYTFSAQSGYMNSSLCKMDKNCISGTVL